MEDCQKITLQEGITKVLHHMITANAKSPVISSRFHSHSAPAMSIGSYVERIVKYTRCSCEALVGSLMFLQYHVTFSGHCVTVFNVHRTLITSVVLAAKSRDDEYYTNTYYAKIGGIPAAELKTLELDYINLLEWDCWLDRDAFDETVAMLTELATTNPSPSEIAQAVTFWEEKQSRFARNRRRCVREAIAADVDIEKRKASMLQHQPNSGNASTSSYHSNNNPQQHNNISSSNNDNSNAIMGSSVGSDHHQHLERLAFGANTPVSNGSGAATVPSSTYKDPTTGSMMGSASSSSNLIVTAPCFYPKGMRAPATSNSAKQGMGAGLGSNPYQQQQQASSYDGLSSYVSPYQSNNNNNNNTSSSGRTLNPYGNWGTNNNNNNNNNGTAPKASSYYGSGLSGASSAFPSQPIQSKPPSTPTSANGGNASSWAAVAASVNTTPNTASTRSNRGGGTNNNNNANNNNNNTLLLAPNSASKTNNNTSCKSDQTLSHNNSMTLPPSPTAQAQSSTSRSPTYIPQGAPGFNTVVGLNPAAVAATASNNRVLTKNRFNGSGDSLNGSSGLQTKTPESSRYSIVGINANQHPNSYYSYTTESNQHQHMAHSPTSARGGAAGRLSSGGKSATTASSPNSASTSAFPSGRGGNKNNNGLWKNSNPNANTGSSDSVNNSEREGGEGKSPGIKLSAADASAAPSSYDQNLVTAKPQHNNNNNGDDEDDGTTVPFERAGSKRRQTGKKREVPSHWQDDR